MKALVFCLAFGALGCAAAKAPQPVTLASSRGITNVQGSFGRTWDAVIDVFGERNIPIKQMERASGFIATDNLALGREDQRSAKFWATCERRLPPTHAVYNVIVRGDSTNTTVKVNVKWERTVGRQIQGTSCESTRAWEICAEDDIKARAERQPAPMCAAPATRRGRDD